MIKILAIHLWLPRRADYVSKGKRKFTTKNRGTRKHLPSALKGTTQAIHKNCFSVLRYDRNILVKLLWENVRSLYSLLGLKPSYYSISHIKLFKVQNKTIKVTNWTLYQSFSLPFQKQVKRETGLVGQSMGGIIDTAVLWEAPYFGL